MARYFRHVWRCRVVTRALRSVCECPMAGSTGRQQQTCSPAFHRTSNGGISCSHLKRFCTYHQNLLLSECRAQCSSHSPAHLIRECSDCKGIKIFTQSARCGTRRANQIMQARLTSETTTQRTVEDSRQWKLRCSTPSVWIFKVSCGPRSAVQKMKNTDPWRHPSWSVMSSTRVTATTAVNMAMSWNGKCRHLAKSTRPVRICFLLQLESKKHFAVIF